MPPSNEESLPKLVLKSHEEASFILEAVNDFRIEQDRASSFDEMQWGMLKWRSTMVELGRSSFLPHCIESSR